VRLSYWIKERRNPQTGTYWVPYGQLTAAEARRRESTLYGDNKMHRYRSMKAYLAALKLLREQGERVTNTYLTQHPVGEAKP